MGLISTLFLGLIAISCILIFDEQESIVLSNSYYSDFNQYPLPYFGFWTAIFMIAVLFFFRNINSRFKGKLFVWISNFGIVIYILMGLTYICKLCYLPSIMDPQVINSIIVQDLILTLGTMEIERFIIAYGFSALWFIILVAYGIRYKLFNKSIIALSIITSLGYISALLGYFTRMRILTMCSYSLVLEFELWIFFIYRYIRDISVVTIQVNQSKDLEV